jgi:hypothetical protein
MLVYPSICENEGNLILLHEGAGILDYWRSAVGVCVGHHAPLAPIGGLLVAWIKPKASGGFRHPARIFYLNCLGPEAHLDGVDFPGADDHGTLVDPGSITPGKPECEPPKQFGRRSPRGPVEIRFAWLLADCKRQWQRYANAHGFTLPTTHKEQEQDADYIRF